MRRKLRILLEQYLYTIFEATLDIVYFVYTLAASLLTNWAFDTYLAGIDKVLLGVLQTVIIVYFVLDPTVKLYRRLRLLWIETQADIRKAQERAKK